METLLARVAAAAATTPDTARQAVGLVVDFIKREAPEEAVDALLAKAPALNAIVASIASTSGEGMSPAFKGLMGAGAGAMGGGGLMALGPDGARPRHGPDPGRRQRGVRLRAVGRDRQATTSLAEKSAAIPGLAQFI